MNHSNKIEQSMAESEEGRPLIKENTHQASTRRKHDWQQSLSSRCCSGSILSISFRPAAVGTLSGSLVLTDNNRNAAAPGYTTQSISLSGTGVQATPVLAFAPIARQTYGSAPFAVSANSASSGAVTYTVLSGPATIAGNIVTLTGAGTVVLSANQAASGNYTSATATTSLTVGLPFSLVAGTSATSTTVVPGAIANFSFMLTPAGTTLPNGVTFTAAGLPTGAIANFSPATIAAASAATSVTLSIQTANTQRAQNQQLFPPGLASLGFLLLPLFGMKAVRRRLRCLPSLPVVLFTVVLCAILGISGCSGGSSPQPTTTAQNYTVTVTAKDVTNGAQNSMNFILTVQ
jgi:hypothetical protein